MLIARDESDEDNCKMMVMKDNYNKKISPFKFDYVNQMIQPVNVNVSFAVHPDYRSHTGAAMTLGEGAVIGLSKKQKLNTRSSTEAELVGADDEATMIL